MSGNHIVIPKMQRKLLKWLGFDANKTYKAKAAPISGKITHCDTRCSACNRKFEQTGKPSDICCPIFMYIGTTPLTRNQLEEVKETDMFGVAVALEAVKIVEEHVKADRMFTCFDVTKELRNRDNKVFHSDVRKFIHGLNGSGSNIFASYIRFTHTFELNSGPMTAELYATLSHDFDEYEPYDVTNDSDDTKADNPDSQPAVSVVVDDGSDGVPAVLAPAIYVAPTKQPAKATSAVNGVSRSVQRRVAIQTAAKPASSSRTNRDARGRLCVPNAMVRKLGLNPGDTAYIHGAGFGVTVNAATAPGNKYIAALRVDKDTNVRITSAALKKAGITSSEPSLVVSCDQAGTGVVITR